MRLNGPGAVTNSVMASRVTGMNVRRKETVESEEATPSPLKRRKKSTPRQEGDPPPRRGRPPNNSKSPRRTGNRIRMQTQTFSIFEYIVGSDTEDTFETYMNQHNIAMADPNRSCRYNFCVMLDPELDANQRITVLQEKMRELRNTYVSLKTQLAVIDKRRKKLRRKEREMVSDECAANSKSATTLEQSPSATESIIQEAINADAQPMEVTSDQSAGDTNSSAQVAKSFKCDECGKIMETQLELEFHAAKTSHSRFSESTEEKKPLTEEEKRAQLKKVEELMKLKRLEREEKEKKDAIEREKQRIQSGKLLSESRKKLEDEETKRLAEFKRKEKDEEKRARQRVKDQIEQDKLARKAKFGQGDVVLRAAFPLLGGKGGFGSMLRAIGAQIEKTTNREACRDLSGRRLRDINEEKRLKEWVGKQADRDREKEEKKKKKLERLLAQPKHEFHDPEYEKARADVLDKVHDAIEKGLQKAGPSTAGPSQKRKSDDDAGPSKKKQLWLGVSEEDFSDSDSNSDTEPNTNLSQALAVVSNEASSTTPANLKSSSDSSSSDNDLHLQVEDVSLTTEIEKPQDTEATLASTGDVIPVVLETVKESEEIIRPKSQDGLLQQLPPPVQIAVVPKPQLPILEDVDLETYNSVSELEQLGLDNLKLALQKRGLKCGGTLKERAARLWSVRGLTPDQYDPLSLAKPSGKKR
nr:EOG090X0OE5 [Lepidurus arcticus]